MTVDVKAWRDFRIGDLFETVKGGSQVPTGAMYPMKDLHDGDIPRITVTDKNNGEIGRFAVDSSAFKIFENCISVSFLGTVFYHIGQVTFDMKVHCLKPVGVVLNEYSGNFLVPVIKRSLGTLNYTVQVSSSMLPDLTIKLPVTPDGKPDWAYMEQYMQAVMDKQAHVIESLTRISKEKHPVDIRSWKGFRVGELFEVVLSSDDLQPKNLKEGDMPLVSSGMNNNGVCAMVDASIEAEVFPASTITVDMFGKAFYQPDSYFAVSHGRINILKPNVILSVTQGLFFQSVLDGVLRGKYSYSLMCTSKKLADEVIKLPVTFDGKPDLDYMDSYMRQVMDRQEYVVSCLKKMQVERH